MKKLILKHVTNGCFWMNFAVFFKFCTFEKMPKNQLLAEKQVTLALMVLFGLFHLPKLARACTSSDKPEKGLCRFTDDYWAERIPMIGDAGAIDKYPEDELASLPVG